MAAFLGSPPGLVLLLSSLALAISTLLILHHVRKAPSSRMRPVATACTLNVVSVALALAAAEAVVRVFSVPAPGGRSFAGTLLLPRSWESVAAQNRAALEKASTSGSYLVYDEDLGWTVGPSRQSGDYNRELVALLAPHLRQRSPHNPDIYLSSTEGIRSPRVGVSFGTLPAKPRIALVGDSFTFGLEVPYEDTWGHQLELALGSEYQVLNFGVDGYGVDQAYVKYRRDVSRWRPDLVILAVINDDLRRTMCVYGFLCFGIGSQIPFPKPRFVMRENELTPLNLPLPTPGSIFAKRSIRELPFIEDDRSFDPVEWDWRFYHYADSVRFLLSRYRGWSSPGPTATDQALKSVNGELLRSFVRTAHDDGSRPIVVFLPARSDFAQEPGHRSIAREVLQASRIPYLDMTECVSTVSPDERFVTLHYSRATNAAVAACLQSSISSSRPRSSRAEPSATPGGAATR